MKMLITALAALMILASTEAQAQSVATNDPPLAQPAAAIEEVAPDDFLNYIKENFRIDVIQIDKDNIGWRYASVKFQQEAEPIMKSCAYQVQEQFQGPVYQSSLASQAQEVVAKTARCAQPLVQAEYPHHRFELRPRWKTGEKNAFAF